MVIKSPRRKRRVKRRKPVAISFDLPQFRQRLFQCFGAAPVDPSEGTGPIDVRMINPGPVGFPVAYLAEEIFSKFDDGKSSDAKVSACMMRAMEAEALCRETNARLPSDYTGATSTTGLRSILTDARIRVERLLGPFSWNDMEVGFDFGPGSTTRLPRRESDLSYKFCGVPHATAGALPLAQAYLSLAPLWRSSINSEGSAAEIVAGNKVTTVPKNYKTDRCIAIEPDWNMFFQKGIGGFIRRQLRRVGINLNDQRRNQTLAMVGSRDASLATIDLSMASDTVSLAIVRALLPSDWCDALEQVRSAIGVLPSGELITYEKFSSMGNGFTFELESLIFWALCKATIHALRLEDRRLAVYGDDLVVPTSAVPLLLDVLRYAGFVPNVKKTHVSGYFRESCGKHYFHGESIVPFYVRRPIRKLQDLFLLHNNVWRYFMQPYVLRFVKDYRLVRKLILWIRSRAPEEWRKPRIPLGVGDGAFVGTFDEVAPTLIRHKGGWEGWVAPETLQMKAKPQVSDIPSGVLLKALWLVRKRELIEESTLLWEDETYTNVPISEQRWLRKKLLVRRWSPDEPVWSSALV